MLVSRIGEIWGADSAVGLRQIISGPVVGVSLAEIVADTLGGWLLDSAALGEPALSLFIGVPVSSVEPF